MNLQNIYLSFSPTFASISITQPSGTTRTTSATTLVAVVAELTDQDRSILRDLATTIFSMIGDDTQDKDTAAPSLPAILSETYTPISRSDLDETLRRAGLDEYDQVIGWNGCTNSTLRINQ